MRYEPRQDQNGNWLVAATTPPHYPLPGKFNSEDHATAHADLLNAIDEGEPANVINDLRRDRDNAREGR